MSLQPTSPTAGTATGAPIENKPNVNVFPYAGSEQRLYDYDYYMRLLLGDHFSAFNIKIDNEDYNRAYAKMRYVKVNFAGIVSKVVSDMLFSEPIIVKDEENQDFIDAFWQENKMDMQLLESALGNSALGDALFKLRVGKRQQTDKESTIIAEDITPKIYFPEIDGFNVRAVPKQQELAWTFKSGDKTYLRQEIHMPQLIKNNVYEMEGNKIMAKVGLGVLGIPDLKDEVATGIDDFMIVHVANWKTGDRFFGISDYYDMDNLFYALNHRMSQIDNILDKHGDPILMTPPGVLDKNGNVNRKALGVIEVKDGDQKPEYIVWDASLDNAFKYIEKLVEFMYLVGEISPDVLGLGEGVSDSGRALKFKLMRTIAKVARKKVYYDQAIKQIIYVAEKLAVAHNLKIGGVAFKGEPKYPEIQWADGLPIDISETIETETKAIDAGLTSKRDAIMRTYQVDEDTADEMVKNIKDETAIEMPKTDVGGSFFGKKNENTDQKQQADDEK